MEEILRKQKEINDYYSVLAQKLRFLPIKTTSFFQKKVDEEINQIKTTSGPLCRIAYPSDEKILLKDKNEVKDFIDDRSNMPPLFNDILVRKYKNRVLLLTTTSCLGHCQYCFRQDLLMNGRAITLDEKILRLKKYLEMNSEIEELVLSGGEPLTLATSDLEKILTTAQNFKISVRIHTKAISYDPESIKPEMLQIFKKHRVRLVFHIAHPYEICSEVIKKIKEIQKHEICCYNQFPLLRNINDHPNVLIKLLLLLDQLQVRNLSIFYPEPVLHSMVFRINLERIFSIIDEFCWRSPSWINSTRFVLDSPIGKVRRENLKKYLKNQYAVFSREEKEIIYPDLSEEWDIPGKLSLMLWKETF